MLASALPVRNRAFNLICTNVPSAPVPTYFLGHLLLEHYPLVPLSPDVGLGAGVFSYHDKLFFALTAESNAVPDIDLLQRFVEESFAELRAAARAAARTNGASPTSDTRDAVATPERPRALG